MYWYEFATNPREVTERYAGSGPDLEGQIIQINMFLLLNRIEIRMKLDRFPDFPSPRWNKKSNSVVIKISMHSVVKNYINFTPGKSKSILRITTLGEKLILLNSSDENIKITFEVLHIDGFDAHYSE